MAQQIKVDIANAVLEPTPTSLTGPWTNSADASAAAKLITFLQGVSQASLYGATASAPWIIEAADQGQNADQNSLIKKQITAPVAIDSSSVFKGWVAPTVPSLPNFPTLPTNLTLDFNALKTQVAADVTNLQNSWMAKFLPASPPDFSRVDALNVEILSGANAAAAKALLDSLETDLKAALTNSLTTLNNGITNNIAASKAALSTNVAGLQPKIDAAINLATSNIAAIAVARARDQAAREGARLESEAISDLASRGFALPSGILTALQQSARQATLNAASSVAGDMAIRAQVQYVELAKMSVNEWQRVAEFQLKSEIEAYRNFAEIQLRGAALEMENNRAKVKQAFDHLGLRLDFSKFSGDLAVKYRLGVIESMNHLIAAYAQLNHNETEYLTAIAAAQRANLAALIDYYKLSLQEAEIGIKVSLANNENTLKYAEIAAQFIGTSVGHHVTAAAQAADIYAKVSALAFSGLNGVASATSTG